jgi:hypothetical protein
VQIVLLNLRAVLGSFGLENVFVLFLAGRVNQVARRIERMLVQFEAGTLRRRTMVKRQATGGAPDRAPGAKRVRRARAVMPRKFGWLVQAGGYRAVGYGLQLRAQLETPEMTALLAASPQAVRILRPLCRALAVELPWVIDRPRKPREKKPRKPRRRTYAITSDFNPPMPRGMLAWARKNGCGKRPPD